MKFLFVAYGPYEGNNAVLNICREVARQFVLAGDSVTVLGHTSMAEGPKEETIDGATYQYFYQPSIDRAREMWVAFQQRRSLPRLATAMVRHPAAALLNLRRAMTGTNPVVGYYANEITKQCQLQEYDGVVSFSAPYHTAMALAAAATGGAKKLVYMADPYATHHELGGAKAMEQEAGVLARVDKAFVTRQLFALYPQTPLAAYIDKLVAADFPCVARKTRAAYDGFNKEKVNCLFAGYFYDALRPAAAFMDLVAGIASTEIAFTAMGNLADKLAFEEGKTAESLVMAGWLEILPMQPPAVSYGAMAAADVLVNIGNTNPEMLPSKLFDYISAGKPIVNVYLDKGCPSLEILKGYPFALNLFWDGNGYTAGQTKEFEVFCRRSKGKALPFERVEQLYASYTPSHLRALFMGAIQPEDI